MTLETIKTNVDHKIEKFLDTENKTLPYISKKLGDVVDAFQKMLEIDDNSSAKNAMIQMYVDHSIKRIKDFEFVEHHLIEDEYFAGSTDLKFFNLIKFRDKVSSDVFLEA